ncbi:SMC-Scp complex subunit ScpB [Candidatus Nanohalococcus occultus]|uniref:Chromosome segregation and condensation protein B n=1 Tax=Candidatus Nanohalococcus occultus TaxID=2978047 RepID=A0ABY8CGR8_9ARCH|nr:Chromosome segregation and condensation protein B [Candidatus Nanohaloarchaeota archaeon SVXNc]
MDEKKARLEAAFFLADKPVDREEIADILDLGSMGYVETLVNDVREDLEEEHRGLELVETPEGYELKVKKGHIQHVSHLAPHQDLNQGELRTLALIAYNAPVEQTDIVEIRGNRAYQHVKELVKRGFLSKEKDGRTAILDVTDQFLEYFDFDSVDQFKQEYENEEQGRDADQQGVEMF